MPRSLKITDERTQRVHDSIAAGNTEAVAAGAAGLGTRTHWRYLQRGQAADLALAARLENEWADDQIDQLAVMDEDTALRLVEHLVPEDERPFWRYWHAVTRARDRAEERAVALVMEAAVGYEVRETVTKQVLDREGKIVTLTETRTRVEKDWRAAFAWLERRRHREWGKRTAIELAGPDGGPIPVGQVEDTRRRGLAIVENLERRALGAGGSDEAIDVG